MILKKMNNKDLSELEKLWLERLKYYLATRNSFDFVCSWWLRLEYEETEKITTTKINRILSKLVTKNILKKETTRSYTKFYLNIT